MTNRLSGDDEVLARLIREAGDPVISPDPRYAEIFRATILGRVGPEQTVPSGSELIRKADAIPATSRTRVLSMKHLTSLAVAATVLLALGTMFWTTVGGSNNIAFADVIQALDKLRTATYDFASESEGPDGRTTTINSKGFFLAPSLERVEMSMSIGPAKDGVRSIMILDCLAAKGITLLPEQKKAMIINISSTEKSTGGTAHMFEMVRSLVRNESTDAGEAVEALGEKEIDGSMAVGFQHTE